MPAELSSLKNERVPSKSFDGRTPARRVVLLMPLVTSTRDIRGAETVGTRTPCLSIRNESHTSLGGNVVLMVPITWTIRTVEDATSTPTLGWGSVMLSSIHWSSVGMQ